MDLRRRVLFNLMEDEDMGKVIFCDVVESAYIEDENSINLAPDFRNCFYVAELITNDSGESTTLCKALIGDIGTTSSGFEYYTLGLSSISSPSVKTPSNTSYIATKNSVSVLRIWPYKSTGSVKALIIKEYERYSG